MIDARGPPFHIFNGQGRCCDQKTLSIVGPPRNFDDEPFGVHVNLKDGKGRVVSRGHLEWYYSNCDGPISFYDRHICSVIQGDIGYVAVHYSMFKSGLQARIRVSFVSLSIPQAFVNVFGRITAEYGNYEYSTLYDQEYYKSTLFPKPQDECVRVNLDLGSTLPLSKSVMSVPLGDSLILDVNLKVIGPFVDHNKEKIDDTQEFEAVQELVEFEANVGTYFLIKRTDFVISMCIEWSTQRVPKPFTHPILPDERYVSLLPIQTPKWLGG